MYLLLVNRYWKADQLHPSTTRQGYGGSENTSRFC